MWLWGANGSGGAGKRQRSKSRGRGGYPERPDSGVSVQLRHVCLEYPYRQLEEATRGFHESCRLGEGSAGTVYRAELPDGSNVAVKVIDLATLGDNALVAGFEEEIFVLSKFRHPNLVVLMGWAREGARRFLMYEFLEGGDVAGRLQKCKEGRQPFFWFERLGVARDAATGLAHLHGATPRAFHRDIKSSNILLGISGAKMADFGLSCMAKTRTGSTVRCAFPSGTPGYTCPNYVKTGQVTEGSEVYSFGMVILEVLLNMVPAGLVGGDVVYQIQDAIMPGTPGALERAVGLADPAAHWPPPVAREVAVLGLRCIDNDESQRPVFVDVCRTLRGIQDQFPPHSASGPQVMPAVPHRPPMPAHPMAMGPPMPAAAPLMVMQPRPPALMGPPQPCPVVAAMPPRPGPYLAAPVAAIGAAMPPPMVPPVGSGMLAPPVLMPPPLAFGPGAARAPAGTHVPPMAPPPGSSIAGLGPGPGMAFGPPPQPGFMPQQPSAWGSIGPHGPQLPPVAMGAGPGRPPCPHSVTMPEVMLEVAYVHLADLSTMRGDFRRLPLIPSSVDAGGRRSVRLGRQYQPQWFEAVLVDAQDLMLISREACEVTWAGANPEHPTHAWNMSMLSLGSGIVLVEDVVVKRGDSSPLRPGSRISFGFHGDAGEVCIIMTLVVHCPGFGGSASTAQGAAMVPDTMMTPVTIPYQQPLEDGNWRLECVYTPGFTPDEFLQIPALKRILSFALAVGTTAIVLGRQHQREMFEALLERDKDALMHISRSHFKLEAVASEDEGNTDAGPALRLTNLSQHCATVDEKPLRPNESVEIRSGDTFSFASHAALDGDVVGSMVGDGCDDQVAIERQPTAPELPKQPAQTNAVSACSDAKATAIVPFLTLRLVGPTAAPQPAPWMLYSEQSFKSFGTREDEDAPPPPPPPASCGVGGLLGAPGCGGASASAAAQTGTLWGSAPAGGLIEVPVESMEELGAPTLNSPPRALQTRPTVEQPECHVDRHQNAAVAVKTEQTPRKAAEADKCRTM